MEKSNDRLKILEKIKEFEQTKRFNDDVEDDAQAQPIKPNEVDYINKKLSSKLLTIVANKLGKMFFENMIKHKKLIIKQVYGIENALNVKSGAIITCNHFNLCDNYVVYKAIKPALKKRHNLYKVIKEGNYTNFKGPVRIMMRHANTLPLSSNYKTMKKFYCSMETLLARGEKILIYPEQAMWWNYKKPRPLKNGAFKMAARFNVPIIPIFITMRDSDILDDDGFYVQEYYVHFLPAIYPDQSLSENVNAKIMMKQNHKLWVETYESFYKTKLEPELRFSTI